MGKALNDSVFGATETEPVLMINAGGFVRQIAWAKDKGFGPLAFYKGLGHSGHEEDKDEWRAISL